VKAGSSKKRSVVRSEAAAAKAYLMSLPFDARAALQKLRRSITAAAPTAKLGFSYGIPAFRLGQRPLVWFAAFKHHCSFFPGPAAIRIHAADLQRYKTSKGTIQFPLDRPLPETLVAKLVKARIEEFEKRRRLVRCRLTKTWRRTATDQMRLRSR
jgi:uncharacterized protein YdhG (YjbR/CyaY superfamily)